MKPYQLQSYYELLEVPVSATTEQIRSAYERLLAVYTDDQVALYGLVDSGSAGALRAKLREAMEVLTDDDLRAIYDDELGLPPRSVTSAQRDEEDSSSAQLTKNELLTGAERALQSTHPFVPFSYVSPPPAARPPPPSSVPRPVPAVPDSSPTPPPAPGRSSAWGAPPDDRAAAVPTSVAESGAAARPSAPASAAETSAAAHGSEPASVAETGAAARPSAPASAAETSAAARPSAPSEPASVAETGAAARPSPPSSAVEASAAARPSAPSEPASVAENGSSARPSAPASRADAPAAAHAAAPSTPSFASESAPTPRPSAPTPEPSAPASAAAGAGRPTPPGVAQRPAGVAEAGEGTAFPPRRPTPAQAPQLSESSAIEVAETQLAKVAHVVAERDARASAPRPKPPDLPPETEFNGELLRKIRTGMGISLQHIADKTRVAVRHLESVEADRYSALPAPVYLRGILMSLARELGLDGLRVAKSYLSLVERAKG